jgi:hypothetical protein
MKSTPQWSEANGYSSSSQIFRSFIGSVVTECIAIKSIFYERLVNQHK